MSEYTTDKNVKTHELKTWPEFFSLVCAGVKKFEIRKNDREYSVGDILHLREYDPHRQSFTGFWCDRRVVYLIRGPGFGLEPGYVCMSLELAHP